MTVGSEWQYYFGWIIKSLDISSWTKDNNDKRNKLVILLLLFSP